MEFCPGSSGPVWNSCWKCRCFGIAPCFIASITLISAATPAADSRWPKLVFTEPISSGRSAARPLPYAAAVERQLKRITHFRPRPVRLHVIHIRGQNPRPQQRRLDDPLLRRFVGYRQSRTRPILVDRRASDHAPDPVAPSASASLSRFRTTIPQPSPRTYPFAAASNVLHRPSGANIPALARSIPRRTGRCHGLYKKLGYI